MKVLLLEDDMILHEVIEEYLQELSCEVVSAFNGMEAEEFALRGKFDLLLLDVNVPGIDGFTFLKNLRDLSDNTPAIFMTSLNSGVDVAKGFASGGNDYLKKPFDLLELKARIDNIKCHYHIDESKPVAIGGERVYDYAGKTVHFEGVVHPLSHKEAAVLEYFLQHPQQVLGFDEILNNVWSYEDAPTHATLRTYIKTLRRVLGDDAITNIKGVGYRFH